MSDSLCDNCIDNKNTVFNILSQAEKEVLKKGYSCRSFKKGEEIFKEGDKPVGLICLSEGKVKVFKHGVGGREQIVRLAKPTGFIGYRALFADERHTATAVAIEDSITCIISRESLFKTIRNNSELALNIIKAFAAELGFTINRTVTLTQKHIRGRLAESLIFFKDTYGFEDDEKTLRAYLSREDIANLSSMTTSNAIVCESYEEVLSIPLECLHHEGEQLSYVFVKQGSRILKKQVRIGKSNDNEVIILEGLQADERVFLSVPDKATQKEIIYLPQKDNLSQCSGRASSSISS
ncbi:MAG: cyclic nucleotide-binding domain-containing protein [Bacteroidales bacterium]|nr:cyclic nucleotide-binding domain-containing protein [Bacteroidales bacterium]